MKSLLSALRSVAAQILATISSLASFGVLLAALSMAPWSENIPYKVVAAIVSAGIAFGLGGFVAVLLGPGNGALHAVVFGVLFGGFASMYLFGATLTALPSTVIITGCSFLGGWLARRLLASRDASHGHAVA